MGTPFLDKSEHHVECQGCRRVECQSLVRHEQYDEGDDGWVSPRCIESGVNRRYDTSTF